MRCAAAPVTRGNRCLAGAAGCACARVRARRRSNTLLNVVSGQQRAWSTPASPAPTTACRAACWNLNRTSRDITPTYWRARSPHHTAIISLITDTRNPQAASLPSITPQKKRRATRTTSHGSRVAPRIRAARKPHSCIAGLVVVALASPEPQILQNAKTAHPNLLCPPHRCGRAQWARPAARLFNWPVAAMQARLTQGVPASLPACCARSEEHLNLSECVLRVEGGMHGSATTPCCSCAAQAPCQQQQ